MKFREHQTEQKLRGGYYTPRDLASFLVRWIKPIGPRRVLEPSCGDGAFFPDVACFLDRPHLLGFEIDETEARRSKTRLRDLGLDSAQVRGTDFLAWAADQLPRPDVQFDAVLGNPPYIRYQYLPARFQEHAQHIFKQLACRFTRHTNAWVPFVLASMALLRPGGRLAMVVPAEIIHVAHAQGLRSHLGRVCSRIVLVDPEELWFEGTLQGTVLLLAEKKAHDRDAARGLAIHPVRGREFLHGDPERNFRTARYVNGAAVAGKWTHALLEPATRAVLQELEERPTIRRFAEVAEVDVGIVTGANKFFLVDDDTVDRFNLDMWAHPMFGRSDHCPGVIYDARQHAANAAQGKPTNFVWFDDADAEHHRQARRYIRWGESQRLHTRYKCRIRRPWYTVPSVYATEVGMLKRAHHTPRLIRNALGAYTTDTAYRIQTLEGTADQLVYAFLNALTALSAELEGRHYGGGVLELVPSEIERLLLPRPACLDPDLPELDRSVRTLSAETMLARQTEAVLGQLGVTAGQQAELLAGWRQLRDRRHRVPRPAA
ncbi:MAG: N-6 DNA methylase [Caldilineaceae bacterium]|nr:N-6 DNA methylase [Caldilineaceae bacterium]